MSNPSPDRGPDTASRLFVALSLADEVRRGLEAHLRGALGGRGLPGRVAAPASWHFTLRFLGPTPHEAAARLREELRAAPLGPSFTLGFGGLGAFPRPRRASVLWMGVDEGAEALHALAARVEEAAVRAGFPAEPKPFRAHLTLSRLQPPADVTGLVERVAPYGGRLAARSIILFRSHLGTGVLRYEAVERFTLEEGPT
jgi:2'-5' RNA ligase